MSKQLLHSAVQFQKEQVVLSRVLSKEEKGSLCDEIISPVILCLFAVSSTKNWLSSNLVLMMGAVGLLL